MREKSRELGRILAFASTVERSTAALPASRRDIVLLQLAVAYFVTLKLAYGIFVPPNGDEAYYWLWGGHLQLSYYDHAPLVGWTSAIGRLLLGWTPAGLHLPAFVTFLVLVYTLHRASRWLAPEAPARYFWLCLAVFCASPLFNALTTLNYPDHLLVCFASMGLLQLGRYLNAALSNRERQRDLYLGAVCLGLAGLSKYNAAFLPAGLLVAMIAAPRLRRLLLSPHLYAAGALAFAISLPVFIWNAQHQFATVELHAVDRMEDNIAGFTPLTLLRLVLLSILMVSPFLVVPFWRFLFGRAVDGRQAGLTLLARGTVVISTLFMLPLSTWGAISDQVAPHWLVLSFLPFMLLAPFYLRSGWLIGLHLGWGALVTTTIVIYYVLAPLPTALLGVSDGEATRTFGQAQLAEAVSTAASENDAERIVVRGYTSAARLAFGLGSDERISDLGGRIDRLTGRGLGPADAGSNMLLIGNPKAFASRFEAIEPLRTITPTRFDRPLAPYELLLGRGFRP